MFLPQRETPVMVRGGGRGRAEYPSELSPESLTSRVDRVRPLSRCRVLARRESVFVKGQKTRGGTAFITPSVPMDRGRFSRLGKGGEHNDSRKERRYFRISCCGAL